MTAIAGGRQVGKGAGEARTVFCLDCCRERHEGFFYDVILFNRNVLVEPGSADQIVLDLSELIACEPQFPNLPADASLICPNWTLRIIAANDGAYDSPSAGGRYA